jgi:hypothetical protein
MLNIDNIDNASVEIYLMGRVYPSSLILKFALSIPLNGVPYGIANVQNVDDSNAIIHSGEYGIMQFNNTGSKQLDNTPLTFVVMDASPIQVVSGTNNSFQTISFRLGAFETMDTRTFQKYGTSTETMQQVFKHRQIDEPVIVVPPKSTGDMMNWIVVKADMEQTLNDIVEHSFLEGDYVYYTFSTEKCNYVVSSINRSKEYYKHQLFMFYVNAKRGGNASMFEDSDSGYVTWFYTTDTRWSDAGQNKKDLFPHITYMTLTDNKPDIGLCDNPCFSKLLKGAGYTNQEEIDNAFGPAGYSFGDAYMIRDCTVNTHNMYQISPFIRRRYIASLGKKMSITLTNLIGPDVGSTVYVYAKSKELRDDFSAPDNIYCDEYVVLGKQIIKNDVMSNGSATSEDTLITVVTLGSPNLLYGHPKEVEDEIAKIKFPEYNDAAKKV